MSTGYNNRKKAKRKALDLANPERRRIRRRIKAGILPRWMAMAIPGIGPIFSKGTYKSTDGTKSFTLTKSWPIIRNVFRELTK